MTGTYSAQACFGLVSLVSIVSSVSLASNNFYSSIIIYLFNNILSMKYYKLKEVFQNVNSEYDISPEI